VTLNVPYRSASGSRLLYLIIGSVAVLAILLALFFFLRSRYLQRKLDQEIREFSGLPYRRVAEER
jgi:hypothetical protein